MSLCDLNIVSCDLLRLFKRLSRYQPQCFIYIYVYTEAWTQTYCSYLFVYSGYLRLVLDDFTYVLVNSEGLFLTSGITAATTT